MRKTGFDLLGPADLKLMVRAVVRAVCDLRRDSYSSGNFSPRETIFVAPV
jgi:hypothetical protein